MITRRTRINQLEVLSYSERDELVKRLRAAKALEAARAKEFGSQHPERLAALSDLAQLHRDLGQLEKARELDQFIVRTLEATNRDHDPAMIAAQKHLESDLFLLERLEDAAQLG